MSFVVSLTLEGNDYPAIPELALLWEREGAYVWRVSDGKSENVKVERRQARARARFSSMRR